jgi:hypothetical protein
MGVPHIISPSSSEEGFGEENAGNRVGAAAVGLLLSDSVLLPNPSSKEEGLTA